MIRAAMFCVVIASMAMPATAEVRFGNNVRVGGNDVSNQTFTKQKRGKFIVHERTAPKAGCSWKQNRDGSKTRVCHLVKKKSRDSR